MNRLLMRLWPRLISRFKSLFAGSGISGRVIVYQDDSRRVKHEAPLGDFPRVDGHMVDGPLGLRFVGDQHVLAIESGPAVRCTAGNGYVFTNIRVAGNRQDDKVAKFDFFATTGGHTVGANVYIEDVPTPGFAVGVDSALPIHYRDLRVTHNGTAGTEIILDVADGVPDQKIRLRAQDVNGGTIRIRPAKGAPFTFTANGQVREIMWQEIAEDGTGSWISIGGTL